MKIEGELLPRMQFLLRSGGEKYLMHDKPERWCLIGVLKMVPGRKDNHPNREWQLPSSMGEKNTRCGLFVGWNWPLSYHLRVPQYRRLPMLDILMCEAYSRGCKKTSSKITSDDLSACVFKLH